MRKWQRYCVFKRLFSFVCVKRWGNIFALFFIRLPKQSSWRTTCTNSECCTNTGILKLHWSRFKSNKRPRTLLRFAVLHVLYSKHIFRKPIEKTHTRHEMKRWKRLKFLCNGTGNLWQTYSSTTYQRVKERYALSTLCLLKQTLLTECRFLRKESGTS